MRYAICILLLPLFLISCFEVLEEVSLNKDGSGHFKYTVNFSQSASQIRSLLLQEHVDGYVVPSRQKINKKYTDICRLTRQVKGISNVDYNCDLEYFIFTYSCDFSDITALNSAVDSVQLAFKHKEIKKKSYFSYSVQSHLFERKGDSELLSAYLKMTERQRSIFIGANYTCLYRFEASVDTTSNLGAKIAINRKAVFYQLDVLTVMTEPASINQKIQLK